MKTKRKRLFVTIAALMGLVAVWTFDPAAWRVRLRFPSARITDCHESRWSLPAFLHAHRVPPTDLYDGGYLSVELSDQTVDLNHFRDVPFIILVLNRCTVPDLRPIEAMHLGNRGILFKDCDLSATSAASNPGIPDARHATYAVNPP